MSRAMLRWFMAALLVLLGGLLVWWWLQNFELAEGTRHVPPRGEASYNPLYALGKTLGHMGWQVQAHDTLNLRTMDLRPGDALVLAIEWSTLTAEQESALMEWVESGGALLFRLPETDALRQDSRLLEWIGISLHETRTPCLGIHAPRSGKVALDAEQQRREYLYCAKRAFSLDSAATRAGFDLLVPAAGGHDNLYVMGRSRFGEGQWFSAATLNFLENSQLQNPHAAALAWQVLRPMLHQGGRVHLVYGLDLPPLHVLLLRHGWPVLLPLLAALLAWLWLRGLRFGPLVPEPAAARQALREHVAAAGAFAFHGGAARALYAPLRRACLRRLRRTDPELAALDGEDLVQAVAARTGRSRERLRRALLPDRALQHPERFKRAVQLLSQLIHDS